MSATWWGAVLGLAAAGGLLLVAARLSAIRRPQLALRVLPYLQDLPVFERSRPAAASAYSPLPAALAVFGPAVRALAGGVERVLGGAPSVRRRLDRAGLTMTVADFRVQQVVWGLGGSGSPPAGPWSGRWVAAAARSPARCCAWWGSRSV